MARSGYKPPKFDATKGMCCECCANYADGRYVDCRIADCPMYANMPYREMELDLMWVFGRWSAVHDTKRRALGLTHEEYLDQYIRKPNGKITLGFVARCRAKCFRCCADFVVGGGEKGKIDCQIIDCPIYYWMPFRKLNPDLNWIFDLGYTVKHKQRMIVEGFSREEYIDKFMFGSGPVKTIRVRRIAEEE